MNYKHNPDLVELARSHRKHMTKEELHLWLDFLRDYPEKFVRQKILDKYILDFYCPKASMAVEVDGSQHYSDEGAQKDAEREKYLKQYGITVIHIQNDDVMCNFEGVCNLIDVKVKEALKVRP